MRRAMVFDDDEHLEVDDETGQLFWRGKPVVTGHIVRLRLYELILATLGAAGALFAGIHPFGVTFGWW